MSVIDFVYVVSVVLSCVSFVNQCVDKSLVKTIKTHYESNDDLNRLFTVEAATKCIIVTYIVMMLIPLLNTWLAYMYINHNVKKLTMRKTPQ